MQTVSIAVPRGTNSPPYAAGQGRGAPGKWHLLTAVEESREGLGLKGTTIAVLRAMLSFLHSDRLSAAKDADHICFASNAALAKRAHVSVQTVERHVGILVRLGLVNRRSSANGKRWARRDGQGAIVMATGLSLLPLVERYAELVQMGQAIADRRQELELLRKRCAMALAAVKDRLTESPAIKDLVDRATRILRRKPDGEVLQALLRDLAGDKSVDDLTDTAKTRDSAHGNEGHKETDLNRSVEEGSSEEIHVSVDQMERAFPKLCAELRLARSQSDCQRQMDNLAAQLDFADLWLTIKDLGPATSFMILGYVLERLRSISNPRAYTYRLFQDLQSGRLNYRTLLRKPTRQPLGYGMTSSPSGKG